EVFLHRRLGDVALPELASQPAGAVFEETRGGGRIVEGFVVARAILLVVHVLAEGAAEGGGMRPREDGEGSETLGMAEGGEPGDLPAQVGPHEVKGRRAVAARRGEIQHVGDEPIDAVGSEPRRIGSDAGRVAALIWGDRAIACGAEGGNLLAPRMP